MTRRKRPTESRPARHTDDAERAAVEACELLGFGNEPSRLCASDRLKVDLVSTLRLVIDHAGQVALEGGTADIGRLVGAVEQLTKLLPKAATEAPSHREDPRKALLALILQMRDRDEIADRAEEPSLREQVAGLQAENARLRAALAAKAGAPSPGSSPPDPAPNTPPADNVVPLKTAKTSPSLDDITASYPAPAEPWRAFSGGGGRLDPWSDNRE
jgi:hypothetical protein